MNNQQALEQFNKLNDILFNLEYNKFLNKKVYDLVSYELYKEMGKVENNSLVECVILNEVLVMGRNGGY